MRNTLTNIAAGAVIVAALVASFLCGRFLPRSKPVEPPIIQSDTIILRDTITRSMPVYTRVYVRDTIRVAYAVTERDTIYVPIPIEVKEYRDTNYYARVSGYRPSLDYIETYGTTRTIVNTQTQTRTEYIRLRPRFSAGVSVGYGIPLVKDSPAFAPYIGVGVQWNLFSWGYDK